MTFNGHNQHAIGKISSKVTTLQLKKLLNYSSYEKVISPQNLKIHDPSHMNVISPKQIHDPKLVMFPLNTYIV
jgi:hypothetical protein